VILSQPPSREHVALQEGGNIDMQIDDTSLSLSPDLSRRQRDVLLAGGLINWLRDSAWLAIMRKFCGAACKDYKPALQNRAILRVHCGSLFCSAWPRNSD
tara:strand:+ start:41213 stop:41512 length:300 start_codon:yes stop_codon:yes gene_type:complete